MYLIPIQSFSDIITNSSSETYIVDTSYTAEALQRMLDNVHKENADSEHWSGECCGVIVDSFQSRMDSMDEWELEDAEDMGLTREQYVEWLWDNTVPIDTLKECLLVRVDYGFEAVDKFLVDNFRCIYSDHNRRTDETGRIIKN